MASARNTMTNGSTNGHHAINLGSLMTSAVESAIAEADIYHGSGTTYLHIDNPLKASSNVDENNNSAAHHNPTGAVVPPISLSTTFKHSTPGEPSARHDPNSFGMGFEYSRTGMFLSVFVALLCEFLDDILYLLSWLTNHFFF